MHLVTKISLVGRPVLLTALLTVLLPILRATPSHAHAVGLSRGEYRADGAEVRTNLILARTELVAALPGLDTDRDGALSSREIESARGLLSEWVARGIVVGVSAGRCTGHLESAALTEQDGVELKVAYHCPKPAAAFSVRLGLLADLSLGHRHLATAISPRASVRAVLYQAQPELALAEPSAAATTAASDESSQPGAAEGAAAMAVRVAGELTTVGRPLFRLGVEHILTGYDHLLFLLAVVLVGGRLRSLLGMITAFTLAHSVTLALAALGVWAPRPALVEPAIALSIAYVGIENCLVRDVSRRWRLTFLFGLVHGFGFAGALREVALSAAQLPLALASFNLGVEGGQLAVLAVVLPLVSWLGGRAWFARGGLQATSAAISAAGLWWLVVRITCP